MSVAARTNPPNSPRAAAGLHPGAAGLRLLLALYLFSLIAFLLSVDTAAAGGTAAGRAEQARLWGEVTPLRVFSALQLLFGAITAAAGGVAAMFFLWRPGRLLWAAGSAGMLLYYLVDPRYAEGDWVSLLRGLLLIGCGALTAGLLPAGPSWRRTAGGLLLFALSAPAVRIITHTEASVVLAFPPSALAGYAVMFLSGVIGWVVFRGSGFTHLKSGGGQPGRSGKRTVALSFAAVLLALMTAAFVLIEGPVHRRALWAACSPFIPVGASAYASYSWLVSEGAEVFPAEPSSSILGESRGRLFLGIIFQYLAILTAAMVGAAFMRPGSRFLLFSAHAVHLLYWAPTFWLLLQLRSY